MEETLYFAYGSNINLEQMEHRCPDAQLVGPVTLQNYELQFRGSGFATVSPKKGSVVHGLLWKLTPKSEQALDRYEGYPRHYTNSTKNPFFSFPNCTKNFIYIHLHHSSPEFL